MPGRALRTLIRRVNCRANDKFIGRTGASFPSGLLLLTVAQAAVPDVLEDLGLPSAEANAGRRSPNLIFSANVDGEPLALSYNLGNGLLSTTPESAESTMTAKSVMQRLHLSRGYSPHLNIDSLWAVLVDAMVVSMVF